MKKNKINDYELEEKKPVLVPVSVLTRIKRIGWEKRKYLYEVVAEAVDLLESQEKVDIKLNNKHKG
ncbi:hypothetical protein IBE51_09225 [Francisella philomiragia]|uniref:hypothetical protein n=2 Tax=Francisella philomiragia TaxID=28110 RepID=UPI0019065FAA|nr:hypothetical protein [Francisella philomiragia]MBK2275884.1 hypothetical protein [Francisella philomiragia]MBK2305098.1 hypothetical protein [Francisella philomiragia]